MVVLMEGSLISTEELKSSSRVLGHPSPPIAQFGRAVSSRKRLGGSKLLPFKNDETCASTQSCL